MGNVLGECPWCLTNVCEGAVGGMAPVHEAIVHDEWRWWHQGCIADLTRSDWDKVKV